VLIVTAIDLEARALARHLGLPAVSGAGFPHYRDGAIEVACVGLRASALSACARHLRAPSLVISAGACGALAPELAEGALVVPDSVTDEDGGRVALAPVPPLSARGTLVTVARVITSAADKSRLWMESGAIACDMESMPIVRWARERGAAAAIVRGVSDTAEHGVPADLAAAVGEDGRVRTVAAVRAALTRRGAIRDAL
jgi:adenosylhomocysteine nucleosidase